MENEVETFHKFGSIVLCVDSINSVVSSQESKAKMILEKDPKVTRIDTAQALAECMTKVKDAVALAMKQAEDLQEGSYWGMLNAVIYMYRICKQLSKSVYARECTKFLIFGISVMESNVILLSIKYLTWRVALYAELSYIYETLGAIKAANKVVTHALTEVNKVKEYEECELPIPEISRETLDKAYASLRVLEFRYGLATNTIPIDQWKKRLDEAYPGEDGKKQRISTAYKSTQLAANSREARQTGQETAWKSVAMQHIVDLATPEIKAVNQGLTELQEKRARDKNYDEMEPTPPPSEHSSEEEEKEEEAPVEVAPPPPVKGAAPQRGAPARGPPGRNAPAAVVQEEEKKDEPITKSVVLRKNKEADALMLPEATWRKASANVPLELHFRIITQLYNCKLWDQYFNLVELVGPRLEHRADEVPFVADIDLIVSSIPDSEVPLGYTKTDIDINYSNIKMEIAKIKAKKAEAAKKEAPKEEVKKGAKAPAAPAKPNAASATPELEEGILPSDLVGIDHTYIYLTKRLTAFQDDALDTVEVKMGDYRKGLPIEDTECAYAVPLRMHNQAALTKLPYLITTKNEGEKKFSIIDAIPLIAKHPDSYAPEGFEKIEFDLRQTPADFETVPNQDYVYMCYKTDKDFKVTLREFQMISAIKNLEQSQGTEENKGWSSFRERMTGQNHSPDFTCDLNQLENVANVISDAYSGELGQLCATESADLIADVCIKVYNNYILPLLRKQEYHSYMMQQIPEQDEMRAVERVLAVLFHTLIDKVGYTDFITIVEMGLILGDFHNRQYDYDSAVDVMGKAIKLILAARKLLTMRGVRASDDSDIAKAITANPEEMIRIRKEMHLENVKWERHVAMVLRGLKRAQQKKRTLDDAEKEEEEWENIVKDQQQEQIDKTQNDLSSSKTLTEIELYLQSLHIEVVRRLMKYELQIKRVDTMGRTSREERKKKSTAHIKGATFGRSGMGTADETSATQVVTYSTAEKKMMAWANRNPYYHALLRVEMARCKLTTKEQGSYLKDAGDFIMKASKIEAEMKQIAVKNAPAITAAQLFDYDNNDMHHNHYPYKHLADPNLNPIRLVPEKPSLVSRTHDSITMKIPFFNPKNVDKFLIRKVDTFSLFGKCEGAGTEVSLTNYEFANLGVRHKTDCVVTVEGIPENESFNFAAAAFTDEDEAINGIGESCVPILSLYPMQLPVLWGVLASTAFELRHYRIAQHAAKKVISFYAEKTDVPSQNLNTPNDPIINLRLHDKRVKGSSVRDLELVAKVFVIYVKCCHHFDQEKLENKLIFDPLYRPTNHLEIQTELLKSVNIVTLAVELAVKCKNTVLIRQTIHDLNDNLCDILKLNAAGSWTLNSLIKALSAVQQIEAQYWDAELRETAIQLVFYTVKTSFQASENVLPKSMITPTALPVRKLDLATSTFTKEVVEKKDEEEVINLISIDVVRLEDENKEAFQLFESFLAFSELVDLGKIFADRWKEQADKGVGRLTDPEGNKNDAQIADVKKQMDELIDVYQAYLTAPDVGISKLNTVYKESPRLIEYACKSVTFMVEKDMDFQQILTVSGNLNIPTLETVTQMLDIRSKELEHDLAPGQQPTGEDSDAENIEIDKLNDTQINNYLAKWSSEWYLIQCSLLFQKRMPDIAQVNLSYIEMESIDVGRLLKDEEQQEVLIEDILALLARSAQCALVSESWLQLNNIASVLWNILCYILPAPSSLVADSSWKHIVIIVECILARLDRLKSGHDEMQSDDVSVISEGDDEMELVRVPWFHSFPELNISLFSNLFGFAIQMMVVKERWENLIYLCANYNRLTQNFFALPVLPFKIYAERQLFERATALHIARQNQFTERTQVYEEWKASPRGKKQLRMAMITGEVPPEQQEYDDDKTAMLASIERRRLRENKRLNALKESEGLDAGLRKGSNQAYNSLIKSRKLLEQYGIEARALQLEPNDPSYRMKKKAHVVFANMVISNYKKTIDLFRRQSHEESALAQSLHEQGCLLFSEGYLEEAEAAWSDSIDTIFQQLYIINNFRTLDHLAETYGPMDCLLSGVVCYKLAANFYESSNMTKHDDAVLFARNLLSSTFELSLPHPQHPFSFAIYRPNELTPTLDMYKVQSIVPLASLAQALSYVIHALIDKEMYVEALSPCAFLEYLACEFIQSPEHAIIARLLRGVALIRIGWIDYAFENLQKVIAMVDMPKFLTRKTVRYTRAQAYWRSPVKYLEDQPPDGTENMAAITHLLKLEVPAAITSISSYSSSLALYLKAQILTYLCRTENIEEPTSEVQRAGLFTESEKLCRTILKNLSFEEEITRLKLEYGNSEQPMLDYLKERAGLVDMDATHVQEILVSISRQEENEGQLRVRRLELLLNTRILLSEVKLYNGEISASAKILRRALEIYRQYSEGKILAENAQEAEADIDIPNRDMGRKETVAAPAKKGGGNTKDNISQSVREDYEASKPIKELQMKEQLANWEYRNVPGPYFWLKLKTLLTRLLWDQIRLAEVDSLTNALENECNELNAQGFLRQVLCIRGYSAVQRGDVNGVIDSFERARKISLMNNYDDVKLAEMLSNYAVFLHERTHDEEAIELLKESHDLYNQYFSKIGFIRNPINLNADADHIMIEQRKQEDVKEKAPPPAAKGKQAPVAAVSTEQKQPVKADLGSAKEKGAVNSSLQNPNIYIAYLDEAFKTEVLYAEIRDSKEALPMLDDLLKPLNLNVYWQYKTNLVKIRKLREYFLTELTNYQTMWLEIASTKKKYKKLGTKVPEYGFLNGRYLLNLPNTSRHLIEEWIPKLNEARDLVLATIPIMNKLPLQMNVQEVFLELYKSLQYVHEYRPRVGFKYCPNPIAEEGDEETGGFVGMKQHEQKDIWRVAKDMHMALQVTQQMIENLNFVLYQYADLATANLADQGAKIPREVQKEILEADLLNKREYPAGLFEEAKMRKTACNINDLICYLNRNLNDYVKLPFGREVRLNTAYKLHKYLLTALPAYAQKIKFTFEETLLPQDIELPICDLGKCQGFWEIRGEYVYFSYFFSPLDLENIKFNSEEENIEYAHKDKFMYGEVRLTHAHLSKTCQYMRDLYYRFSQSQKLSNDKFQRDLKYHTVDFIDTFKQIAAFFNPSIAIISEDEPNHTAERADEIIKDLLPEMTDEICETVISVLDVGVFEFTNANLSAILRYFHTLRYMPTRQD